jgi:mevalonate pyrophosphate decarboxylase
MTISNDTEKNLTNLKPSKTVTKIEFKKNSRAFEFWLEGKLKETDSNIHKLMQKIKKHKLDWIEEK